MKTKKMLLLIAVLGLVAFMATSALATPTPYGAVTVLQAGDMTYSTSTSKKVTPSIQFLLTSPELGATAVIAYAVKGQENRMLAVALTAMANGSKVNIVIDLNMPKGAAPVVYNMNLVAAQ
jgi:hypothetical protein